MSKFKKLKWTRSDTSKLSRAVRDFNKEISKQMESMNIKALPKLLTYREVKDKILTKRDLDLALSTLKKVKNKNAFNLESSTTNPNVKYIHWTKMTAQRYDYAHRRNMKKELQEIKEHKLKNGIVEEINGKEVIKVQLPSTREKQLEGYLNAPNINLLETASNYTDFNEILERMTRLAFDSSVKDMAEIYKQNYLRMFEGYEGLNHYQEAIQTIEDMKPLDFFDWAKRNDVNYDDFKGHYDNRLVQAKFDELVSTLGVDVSDSEDIEDDVEDIF